jgi:hypothetical protein
MEEMWPSLEHKFLLQWNAIDLASNAGTVRPTVYLGHHRYPAALLQNHPIDLLAVENGYVKTPPMEYNRMGMGWPSQKHSQRMPTPCGCRNVVS